MNTHRRVFGTLALGIAIISLATLSAAHTAMAQSQGEDSRVRDGRTSAAGKLDHSKDDSISNGAGMVIRMMSSQLFFPCYGGTRYGGALQFTGHFEHQPNGGYYYSSASGTHKGCLRGPTSADFDLHLQKWNGSAWVIVASSMHVGSTEDISTFGIPGYYRWKIYSFNGSGSYNFWRVSP